MSRSEQQPLYLVAANFDPVSRRPFGGSISTVAATMATKPNSGNSSNDKSWFSACSDNSSKGSSMSSSSSSSSSGGYRNVADNVLNSWFFRNQSSGSGNQNSKFKADMNIWMPQSM